MIKTNKKVRHLGPYSRADALQQLDLRTREAKLMANVKRELIEHCGGRPSATQLGLVEQAVQLKLRLSAMDRSFALSGGIQSEHDSRTYLAWSNSFTRTLAKIGVKPAKRPKGHDLGSYLDGGDGPDA